MEPDMVNNGFVRVIQTPKSWLVWMATSNWKLESLFWKMKCLWQLTTSLNYYLVEWSIMTKRNSQLWFYLCNPQKPCNKFSNRVLNTKFLCLGEESAVLLVWICYKLSIDRRDAFTLCMLLVNIQIFEYAFYRIFLMSKFT